MNSQYFAVAASFICAENPLFWKMRCVIERLPKMCFIYFNGYLTPVVDFHVDLFKRAFRYVYSSISFPQNSVQSLIKSISWCLLNWRFLRQ